MSHQFPAPDQALAGDDPVARLSELNAPTAGLDEMLAEIETRLQ